MFCYKCGKEVTQQAQFCEHCGAKLNQVVSQTSSSGNKPNNSRLIGNGWAGVIVLSVLLVCMLIFSFVGAPTSQECIKIINVDGIEVTYRYDYMNFDGETLVQKRYYGTDTSGNVVDTSVTVQFKGCFEGRINASYTPTEEDRYGEGRYYKQVELSGTINGCNVNVDSEKLMIDEDVFAKYTDMIDEVSGCGLYIKFEDGSNTYTKIETSRVWLIVVLAIFDAVLVCNSIFSTIINKKMSKGEFGEREIAIQHRVGIGVLFCALAVLLTDVVMFFIGVRWRAFLFIFVMACVLAFTGVRLIKDCKLRRVVRSLAIVLLILISPILLIFLLLGVL